MANNRMYLFCPPCNSALYLGKTYCDGYFRSTDASLEDDFVDWTEDHAHGGEGTQIELRFELHHDLAMRLPHGVSFYARQP